MSMSFSKFVYLTIAVIIIIQVYRGLSDDGDTNKFEKISDQKFSLELSATISTANVSAIDYSKATDSKYMERIQEILNDENMCSDGFNITKNTGSYKHSRSLEKYTNRKMIIFKYEGECSQ